ncbi:hypothetical protein CHH86_19990 [Bacillus paralicheniformis]|nr:hypothetical protein CHH86_19990 [Bacillus paralicheniformis]
MQTFNFISGVCSILSFIISIFVAGKVIKITKNLNINSNNARKQLVIGRGNKTAGNDMENV